MYRYRYQQPEFEDFYLPFGGKLRSNNRWVILSKIIPWDKFEEGYAANFKKKNRRGAPAFSLRIALGTLIIQEKLGTSDVETVEQIAENPYLQYFLGYHEYIEKLPFDSSTIVHFRKRLGKDIAGKINEEICKLNKKPKSCKNKKDDDNDKSSGNKGVLKIDATCAPADVKYPTDLNLLNEGREKLEGIIDTLYVEVKDSFTKKPRTYRKKARKVYLNEAKKRNHTKKKLRKAVNKQLNFLRRDFKHINNLIKLVPLSKLSSRQYKDLLVISELYRQQQKMYDNKKNQIDNRIISISQPHIRPIVRGKSKAKTEFGAKISIVVVDGFTYLDHFSFDSYNEGVLLKKHIEKYFTRFGCYPEVVQCDTIYRNRENIKYCNDLNIRISGPPLGRKKKDNNLKKQIKRDAVERIEVERKFGLAKRRYCMNLIMKKLPKTAFTAVALTILTMNLDKILKGILLCLFFYTAKIRCMLENIKSRIIYFHLVKYEFCYKTIY